jgi:hypothetical protein
VRLRADFLDIAGQYEKSVEKPVLQNCKQESQMGFCD